MKKKTKDTDEISAYYYERNCQIYDLCIKGMSYKEVGEMFGLTKNTIKTMYRQFRHKYKKIYPEWSLMKKIEKRQGV